jgi:hypothetical protein
MGRQDRPTLGPSFGVCRSLAAPIKTHPAIHPPRCGGGGQDPGAAVGDRLFAALFADLAVRSLLDRSLGRIDGRAAPHTLAGPPSSRELWPPTRGLPGAAADDRTAAGDECRQILLIQGSPSPIKGQPPRLPPPTARLGTRPAAPRAACRPPPDPNHRSNGPQPRRSEAQHGAGTRAVPDPCLRRQKLSASGRRTVTPRLLHGMGSTPFGMAAARS